MSSYKNYIYDIIKNNDDFKLRDLINRGFNINGDNNDFKKSYLYYALSIYNYYMAEQLIRLGAKTNYKTERFIDSVIYKALYKKPNNCYCINYPKPEQINFVKFLLQTKNIPLIFKDSIYPQKDDYNINTTAYQYAVHYLYPKSICELIYNCAKIQGSKDINITNQYGHADELDAINIFNNTRNNFSNLEGFDRMSNFAPF